MMARGRCILRFQRVSPKKVKPVLDIVRGKTVAEVKSILPFLPKKKIATLVEKALKAALASYKEHAREGELPEDELIVSQAKVDRGPILKRIRPAWRGTAYLIRKRLCHITIEVKERE